MVVPKTEIVDTTRIEEHIIREGNVFALGFPNNKWAVLQCVNRQKEQWYLYDPVAEGMLPAPIPASNSTDGITGHQFIRPQRPSSQYANGKPFFVFGLPPGDNHIFQLFFGVSPSTLRVTFQQPFNTDQLGLPIQSANASYNQFGAILGEDTPIYSIGPDSEIIVPPALDFGLGFINDLPQQVAPLLKFRINYIQFEPVTDAEVVYNTLHSNSKTSKKIVGGLIDFTYDFRKNLHVNPVSMSMSVNEIKKAIGGV